MRTSLVLPFVLVASLTCPALGQDFLQPLEEMIDNFMAPPERAAPVTEQDEPAPVPRPRPEGEADEPVDAPLPRPRPEMGVEVPAEPPEAEEPPMTEGPAEEAAAVETEAPVEDTRVYRTACPAVLMGLVEAEPLPPLAEGICGEQSPISVTGVLSRGRMVQLSQPVVTNCEMASALPHWVELVESYALAKEDAGIETVNTGTSYMCRNRNNAEAGDTSEHGFANAVDVTGFTLSDGRTVAVETDWLPASAPAGRLLRFAHDAACTGFTTVLGPEANGLHHDHFHLDLGCHGQSCTARICQ